MNEQAITRETGIGDRSDPGDIITCVAHEMKTPLTALLQALHVLASGRSGALAAPQQRFVSMGIANARALLALTHRLQDMARWDAGGPPMRFEAFDAVHAARSVAESLAALAESAAVAIDVAVGEDLPLAWGDEDLIKDLIFNLAGNALKFTPEGGNVCVVVRRDEEAESGWIEIAVTDDGPGIPQGEEERIFEKFYRASGARAREGLGLGLALARRIVRAHGGTLRARNNEGRGATFSVRLPACGASLLATTCPGRLESLVNS